MMSLKTQISVSPKPTNEEKLMPAIRARIASRLHSMGFRVTDIAAAIGTTQPAVIQYLNGRRGKGNQGMQLLDSLIEPVVARAVHLINSREGRIETVELLEIAKQFTIISTGKHYIHGGGRIGDASLSLLRQRLQLELSAAEKYLEMSNRTEDEYTKLLLRMIASDSIRHGDVVSQIISRMESGKEANFSLPDRAFLEGMLAIEDRASESSLKGSIKIEHPIAGLLLEWIDEDEMKHEHTVEKIISLVESKQ
jgi:predicted transcriptional regulator/rubrerythrin